MEGGYDLEGLAQSVIAHLTGLVGDDFSLYDIEEIVRHKLPSEIVDSTHFADRIILKKILLLALDFLRTLVQFARTLVQLSALCIEVQVLTGRQNRDRWGLFDLIAEGADREIAVVVTALAVQPHALDLLLPRLDVRGREPRDLGARRQLGTHADEDLSYAF